MINESTMQRLSFVKYLYNLAVSQSQQPEPLGAASILMFHDSIEMFLQISSEYVDSGSNKPNFIDYWDLIGKKIDREVTQKESMRRLNKSRVALKHHGTLPSKLDIEAMRASTTSFFSENTEIIFGIEFNEISLISLINCVESRQNLEEALESMDKGNVSESLVHSALAFESLIDNYEKTKISRFGKSPFFFGDSLTFHSTFNMKIEDRKFGQFVDKIKGSIEAMQGAMKVMSLGLDYRKFSKFKNLTPHVTKTMGGRFVSEITRDTSLIGLAECQFCIDFVIESAIKIQEFDYSV